MLSSPIPGEPVEALGRVRSRRCDRAGGKATVRAGAAGERVRAAAGTTERGVTLDLELVEHVLDVGDDVHDGAPGFGDEPP